MALPADISAADTDDASYHRLKNASIRELHDLGMSYFKSQQLDSASQVMTIAASKNDGHLSPEDASLIAEVHNVLGIINFSNSNYAGAYSHFLRAIETWDVPDAPGYQNIAAVYLYYGDIPRAYECLKKVFDGAIERGHVFHASIAMINLLTLDIGSTTIPVDSIRRLITTLKEVPVSERDKRGFPVADTMADAYLLSQAGKHMESARKLKGLLGHLGRLVLPARDLHSVYTLISQEYRYCNMPDSAIAYLDRAQNIASVNDFKDLLSSTYRDKSILMSEIGRPSEAEHFRIKMLELNDSLFNPRELGKIRDIQMAYENSAFEKKLEVIKVKEQMWRIIFIVISVAFLIVVAMLFVLYRKNRAIRDKNRHLFENTKKVISLSNTKTAGDGITNPKTPVPAIPAIPAIPDDDSVNVLEEVNPETATGDDEKEKRKYTSSALSDETRKILLSRIDAVFEDERLFCQENFSLQTVAQLCGTNARYVSQIINETKGQNFASLLNEKRVKVACSRLNDISGYGHLTIEAVIADLGFKSRSTFSKTFKRLTGLTPGEFQRMARESKKEDADEASSD